MFLCFLKKKFDRTVALNCPLEYNYLQHTKCILHYFFQFWVNYGNDEKWFFFHLIENWEQLTFSLRPFADQLTKMMNGEIQQTCKKYPITVQRVPNLQKWDLLAIPIWNYLITIRRTTKIALGNRYI